jgi:hypothetical protein
MPHNEPMLLTANWTGAASAQSRGAAAAGSLPLVVAAGSGILQRPRAAADWRVVRPPPTTFRTSCSIVDRISGRQCSTHPMRSFPPSHVDPRKDVDLTVGAPADWSRPTDEVLKSYVNTYWEAFRGAVEQYFGAVANHLDWYRSYPFHTTVVRVGSQGTVIGHKPSDEAQVDVVDVKKVSSGEHVNIFEIQKNLDAHVVTFDFGYRSYDTFEATRAARSDAFAAARDLFWQALPPTDFERLCQKLLEAEDVRVEKAQAVDEVLDLVARVFLQEPAGFVREETWGFEFKHYRSQRPSAAVIHQLEQYLDSQGTSLDVMCLVSSGDLTSIGRNVSVKNPRIRVWDREVLDRLLYKHSEVMREFFQGYRSALDKLNSDSQPAALNDFSASLQDCPTGKEHFQEYERLGTEILSFVFGDKLGPPNVQSRTADGVQRRDVVFRNNRTTRFFTRIGERFDADFLVVDFKNYADPIDGSTVVDVGAYSNAALGRFVLVVSRQGAGKSCRAAQLRLFNKAQQVILVVSDAQLVEMAKRKHSGEAPEDFLEDALDELLLAV